MRIYNHNFLKILKKLSFKTNIFILTLCILSFSFKLQAATEKSPAFRLFPKVHTEVPVILGVGGGLNLYEHFELGLSMGINPKFYHQNIAKFGSELAGEPSYKDLINAAFQDNSVYRMNLQYNFNSHQKGWHLGLGGTYLNSSGQAKIDTLEDATGNDFSVLRTILLGSSGEETVYMESKIFLADIYVSYSWTLQSFTITPSIGFTKALASDIHIETKSSYDESEDGKKNLRETEQDIENIIDKYGLSPTLGLSISYLF